MGKINADTEIIRANIKQLKLFVKAECELFSGLKTKYHKTGQRWEDLQYQQFYNALAENEKKVKRIILLVEYQIQSLEAKLMQLQEYLRGEFLFSSSSNTIALGQKEIDIKEHTLYELEVLRDDLELTEGDPTIPQLGGVYGKIRGVISGYEAHHIPSKAVQDASELNLPAIAMSAEDHALTDSYRGRQNHIFHSIWYDEPETYRNEAASLIDSGDYIRLVRYELLNIRDRCGHKYDEAINQYLDALKEYIQTNGIPNAVFR